MLGVEAFQDLEISTPCRVFGNGDDDCFLCGPHYKVIQIAVCDVELSLDLVPVRVILLEDI